METIATTIGQLVMIVAGVIALLLGTFFVFFMMADKFIGAARVIEVWNWQKRIAQHNKELDELRITVGAIHYFARGDWDKVVCLSRLDTIREECERQMPQLKDLRERLETERRAMEGSND